MRPDLLAKSRKPNELVPRINTLRREVLIAIQKATK